MLRMLLAAGHIKTGIWHASSISAVRPSGHNTNYSEVRFPEGDQYWWDVGSTEGRVEGNPAVAPSNLLPIGLELYAIEEKYSNDEDDLFRNSEEG